MLTNKTKAIEFLQHCKESHLNWGEYFRNNPEVEKQHVETGEWDDADTHFELADKYQQVMNLITN